MDTENPATPKRNPGDEADPGSRQTGNAICPVCNGSGKTANAAKCSNCGGTGYIVKIVGDA